MSRNTCRRPAPDPAAALPTLGTVDDPPTASVRLVSRDVASTLLEAADLSRLGPGDLELSWRPAAGLFTWNRLDLGFKVRYLELLGADPDRAIDCYAADIGAQTFDSFVEYTDPTKNSLVDYHRRFAHIYRALADGAFDWERRPVLTARDGSLLNGAHRVAAALVLGRPVRCLQSDLDPYLADWRIFRARAVPRSLIEAAVARFVTIAPGCRLGVDTRWQRYRGPVVYRRGDVVIYQDDRDARDISTLTREPAAIARLISRWRTAPTIGRDLWWRASYLGLYRRAHLSRWVRSRFASHRTLVSR